MPISKNLLRFTQLASLLILLIITITSTLIAFHYYSLFKTLDKAAQHIPWQIKSQEFQSNAKLRLHLLGLPNPYLISRCNTFKGTCVSVANWHPEKSIPQNTTYKAAVTATTLDPDTGLLSVMLDIEAETSFPADTMLKIELLISYAESPAKLASDIACDNKSATVFIKIPPAIKPAS